MNSLKYLNFILGLIFCGSAVNAEIKTEFKTDYGFTNNALQSPAKYESQFYRFNAELEKIHTLSDQEFIFGLINFDYTDFVKPYASENNKKRSASLGLNYLNQFSPQNSVIFGLSGSDNQSRSPDFGLRNFEGLDSQFQTLTADFEYLLSLESVDNFKLGLVFQNQKYRTDSIDESSNLFKDDNQSQALSVKKFFYFDKKDFLYLQFVQGSKNYSDRPARFTEGQSAANNANPSLKESEQTFSIGVDQATFMGQNKLVFSYTKTQDLIFEAMDAASTGISLEHIYDLTDKNKLEINFNYSEKKYDNFVIDFINNPTSKDFRFDLVKSIQLKMIHKFSDSLNFHLTYLQFENRTNFTSLDYREKQFSVGLEYAL